MRRNLTATADRSGLAGSSARRKAALSGGGALVGGGALSGYSESSCGGAEHGGDIYGGLRVEHDFSANINPFGMPESALAALASRAGEFSRYPDPKCRALRASISEFEGQPIDRIVCGAGAADIIFRLCVALHPATALVLAPTFAEYERCLRMVGCEVSRFSLSQYDSFSLNDAFLDQLAFGYDIVFLCNPNNPTGRLARPELIREACERASRVGTTLVVDECFLDFTFGESAKPYLKTERLVIVKAFTKVFAMAGLRLGYAMSADSGIIDGIDATAQSWSVSYPAQIAGEEAINSSARDEYLSKTRALIASERQFLARGFERAGVKTYPGDANFILTQSEIPLYEPLRQMGILVRSCGNFIGLDDSFYRFAIKTREENIALVDSVASIVEGREKSLTPRRKGGRKREGGAASASNSCDTFDGNRMSPKDIERRSFEIIKSEIGRPLDPETEPVIIRTVHATADFGFVDALSFSDGVVSRAKTAFRRGAVVVCDTQMTRAGINKRLLSSMGCRAECFIEDGDVICRADKEGVTRSYAAMDKVAELYGDMPKNSFNESVSDRPPLIIAIGNAPTALSRACELICEGILSPAVVIGAPVGFVNVIDSKDALARQTKAPYVLVGGRRGGSPVAAAICNALALIAAREVGEV